MSSGTSQIASGFGAGRLRRLPATASCRAAFHNTSAVSDDASHALAYDSTVVRVGTESPDAARCNVVAVHFVLVASSR
ncbi:hypothetical protein ACFT8P_26585 [Streptomyces sp. NPDC057101]|uniref:hypothetical protein n=1 Tax=Streptomyces sp. NPDC057101 TaxID=3346020 RepID=UPI0036330DFA